MEFQPERCHVRAGGLPRNVERCPCAGAHHQPRHQRRRRLREYLKPSPGLTRSPCRASIACGSSRALLLPNSSLYAPNVYALTDVDCAKEDDSANHEKRGDSNDGIRQQLDDPNNAPLVKALPGAVSAARSKHGALRPSIMALTPASRVDAALRAQA